MHHIKANKLITVRLGLSNPPDLDNLSEFLEAC